MAKLILFRPVGKLELEKIKELHFKAFPARLPEQPFFYPVLSQKYAEEIAERWNKKDNNSSYIGYVLKFEVEDSYIARFPVQTVGKSYHQELWIPAEELKNFNYHILGEIQIVNRFE